MGNMAQHYRFFGVFLLVAGLLSGCSFSTGFPSSSTDASFGSSANSDPSSVFSSESSASSSKASSSSSSSSASVPEADYAAFWADSSTVSVSLSFSDASLYALSHYGSIDGQKWGDVYFPARLRLSFGGVDHELEEVGVRMKGNTSRTAFLNEDGSFMDGKYAHFKVSLKATFDDEMYDLSQFSSFKHDWGDDAAGRKERKKRALFGMEKFDLKYVPRNDAKTYSQEMYCYESFNDAGILAPHAKWADLALADAADSRVSYYEMIEPIDKTFLKNRLGKEAAQGDLYKCVWGADKGGSWSGADLVRADAVEKEVFDANGYDDGGRLAYGRIGVEDCYSGYHPNYQLKTNDDGEDSDFGKMAGLINAVHSCRYRNAPSSLLESAVDVDEFLRFEAMSFLFGNFDDQRMDYNNYYVYFRVEDGKAIYIPYDWDWSLGNSGGRDMVHLDPFYDYDLDGNECRNNIYWDTILKGSSSSPAYSLDAYRATYRKALSDYLAEGYLDGDNYAAFVAAAPRKDELSSVRDYMAGKKSFLLGVLQSR
jgi:spore coat protein CotH